MGAIPPYHIIGRWAWVGIVTLRLLQGELIAFLCGEISTRTLRIVKLVSFEAQHILKGLFTILAIWSDASRKSKEAHDVPLLRVQVLGWAGSGRVA